MPDQVVELHDLSAALRYFSDVELPVWIADGHADLVEIVGKGAIVRTTIDTGRLVTNWQAWVGPSSIADAAGERMPWTPNPAYAYQQIGSLASDIRSQGHQGKIVDKTVIFNN